MATRSGDEAQGRDANPAGDALRQSKKRGATAEELKGVSAVPTEGEADGKGAGAHSRPTPGDEVDPGVG